MTEENSNIETINQNNELLSYIEELEELDKKLNEKEKLIDQYAQRIGTLFAAKKGSVKTLLRTKQTLVNIKEPVLFLERNSGEIEVYHNVRNKEFNVPDLPEGVEKKILLGPQWQSEIPYAGKSFKAYWCHEEYAFPHKWGKPNVYHGKNIEYITNYIENNAEKLKEIPRIPLILDTANVNSEALRDRERKVLIAWERFKAGATAANFMAIGKMILWILLGIAAIYAAWSFFGPDKAAQVVTVATNNGTGVLIG